MALPSSSFAPPSRAGFIAGRSLSQSLVTLAMILVAFLPLLAGASLISWRTLAAALVAAFALTNVRGMSLWHLLMVRLGFALRRATGNTRWTVSPYAVDRTVGVIDIPGPVAGRLMTFDVVCTRYTGASFLWDKATGEATAVIRLDAIPWMFQPEAVKTRRVDAWTRALGDIAAMQDVARVVTQARCLPHLNPRSEPGGNAFADRDVREVEDGPMRLCIGHDMLVSVTVDTGKSKAGTTAREVSETLADRVGAIMDMLEDAGADIDTAVWLNAPSLRGEGKLLFNPDAMSMCPDGELPDDVPMAVAIDEDKDWIHVDQMYQQTMWVERWPNEAQEAGWLADLAGNGMYSLILTQVWIPVPVEKAEHRLNNRKTEIERRMSIDEKLGRPVSERDRSEGREIALRRQELADGYGDVDFQGYVTVLAPTLQGLEAARKFADSVARRRSTSLALLSMQQWAGLNLALPYGQAGRKR